MMLIASTLVSVAQSIAQTPFPPEPTTRPRFDPVSQATRDAALDARMDEFWNAGDRWARWPAAKANLQIDAGDRVWCVTRGTYTPEEFKQSVERAAAGHSPVLHGGRMVLVDTLGRYWCQADQSPDTLLCYDGKQWLAPHVLNPRSPATTAPTSATSQPAGPPARPIAGRSRQQSQLASAAIDDGAGNVYFLTTASSAGPALMHRVSRQGTWNTIAFPSGAIVPRNLLLARQAEGRVVVQALPDSPQRAGFPMNTSRWLSRISPEFSGGKRPIYFCDGQALTAYVPNYRDDQKRQVNQTVPLPDGSILQTFLNTDRVNLDWPTGTSIDAPSKINTLVQQLDSDDFRQRDAAHRFLLRLGSIDRLVIETALKSRRGLSLEQVDAIQEIQRELNTKPDESSEPAEVVFDSRYHLRQVSPLCRPADGSVILLAMKVEDLQNDAPLGPCLISISAANVWTVQPIPAQLVSDGVINQLNYSVRDANGNFWLGDKGQTLLETRTMTTRPALPFATRFGRPTVADADGRVYFEGPDFELFACNTHAAERRFALPVQTTAAAGLTRGLSGRDGWAIGKTVMRIQPDGQVKAKLAPDETAPSLIRPLQGESALVLFTDGKGKDARKRVRLLDGAAWLAKEEKGVQESIRKWQPWLRTAAPKTLTQFVLDADFYSIGLDRDQGLWASSEALLNARTGAIPFGGRRFLEYFDGRNWLDVWAAFPDISKGDVERPPGVGWRIYGTVEEGRLLLLRDPAGRLRGVHYHDRRLQPVEVAGGDLMPPMPHILHAADRTFWWISPTPERIEFIPRPGSPQRPRSASDYRLIPATPGRMLTWRDGKLVSLPWCGKPVSADSSGRVWCIDKNTLSAQFNGIVARCEVGELNEDARVVDSPDGRLWLLTSNGLNELKLSGPETEPTVAIGRSWRWPAMANDFDASFFDQANGLWLGGDCGTLTRIELPQQ